jgi:hypothetical protein
MAENRTKRQARVACAVTIYCYFMVSVSGYWAFGNQVAGNVSGVDIQAGGVLVLMHEGKQKGWQRTQEWWTKRSRRERAKQGWSRGKSVASVLLMVSLAADLPGGFPVTCRWSRPVLH